MIVVADTSPLNYLIRLGHVGLLREIYGRIVIPDAVLRELQHGVSPREVREWALSPPDWLEVISVLRVDARISSELGDGEREAISIALEMHAEVLLIDDAEARVAAEALDLHATGTLAFLLRAAELGHLDFGEELRRLREMRFRVSDQVVARLLDQR